MDTKIIDITDDHILFNKSTFIGKLNNFEVIYKIKSKNILDHVIIWENDYIYVDEIGKEAINKVKESYISKPDLRTESEIIHIAKINGKYYNYNNSYKLLILNDLNIDLICNVSYNYDKNHIKCLINKFNDQNMELDLPDPTNLANNMGYIKEMISHEYPNHITMDKNPKKGNQNSDKLCDDLVYIIKREALDDPETIERLFRFNMIDILKIFNRINNDFRMYVRNEANGHKKDDPIIIKAKRCDCYLFIPSLFNEHFDTKFCKYLTDDLMNIKYVLKTRSINILKCDCGHFEYHREF